MIIIFVIILVTDLAEDDVLAIQPLGLGGAEEELRPVGVGSSVGHGQDTYEKRSIIQNRVAKQLWVTWAEYDTLDNSFLKGKVTEFRKYICWDF